MLFLMQMTKCKYGTKTYHSEVPLRFIKIRIDYTVHIILKNRTCYNKIITHHLKAYIQNLVKMTQWFLRKASFNFHM